MVFFTYSVKDVKNVNFIYELIRSVSDREILYAEKDLKESDSFDEKIRSGILRAETILYFLSKNSSFELTDSYISKERVYISQALIENPDIDLILVKIGQGGKFEDDLRILDSINLIKVVNGDVDPFSSKEFRRLLLYIDERTNIFWPWLRKDRT